MAAVREQRDALRAVRHEQGVLPGKVVFGKQRSHVGIADVTAKRVVVFRLPPKPT